MPASDSHAPGVAVSDTLGRAYCGRKAKTTDKNWKSVTCVDCHAARRADQEAQR